MNNQIQARIKTIKEILNQDLIIPPFQRPYKWKENNVRLLLQDVYENLNRKKEFYHMGSIILYCPDSSENKKEIIDGQQRITTILLILKSLKSNNDFLGKKLCNELEYPHTSQQNIRSNFEFITEWIKSNIDNTNDFYQYVIEWCRFVEITVNDLSEAFQMFDSQNGRGKELEAYNLIKAFHIRSMNKETEEVQKKCDIRWESATMYNNEKGEQDILKQVIDEQLYRTRNWSRKEDAYDFNKNNLDEFKGITFDFEKPVSKFPFLNSLFLQHLAKSDPVLSKTGIKPRLLNGRDPDNMEPFVWINQNIVNGKYFFDYVETYVEMYKQLFVNLDHDPLQEFKQFFKEYCIQYPGSHRTGDHYLREVYKSLIFTVFDKFGEEGVLKHYKTLYLIIYRLRLERVQVKYNAVAKYPKNIFFSIEKETDINMPFLIREAKNKIICQKEIEEIIPFFLDNNVPFSGIDLTKYSTGGNEQLR